MKETRVGDVLAQHRMLASNAVMTPTAQALLSAGLLMRPARLLYETNGYAEYLVSASPRRVKRMVSLLPGKGDMKSVYRMEAGQALIYLDEQDSVILNLRLA